MANSRPSSPDPSNIKVAVIIAPAIAGRPFLG